MVNGTNLKSPVSAKIIIVILSLFLSFFLGQVFPDRLGLEREGSILRTEVDQLKRESDRRVTRLEFEQFNKAVDQRLQGIEKALEKIDRKLDR